MLIAALAVVTPAATVSLDPSQRRHDVRGMWVQRTSLVTPSSISAVVADARRAGINVLLVQVRGRGEAFYRSGVEPRATDLSRQRSDFDPLRQMLAEAHAAGIEVHAWVNVNLVASATNRPASERHIARRHPEWLMVPEPLAERLHALNPRSAEYVDTLAAWTRSQSASIEGLFLSPISDGARAHSVRMVEEIVRNYDVDGLHLDYIRYPAEAFDYSRSALEAFRRERRPFAAEAEREEMDRAPSPLAWTRRLPNSWRSFREDRLTALVAQIAASARRLRPALTISAAVVPDPVDARVRKLQSWPAWAQTGLLDAVCPMTYTPDEQVFDRQLRGLGDVVGSTPVWAGIGAFRLGTPDIASSVRRARQLGAAGVVLFSYEGLIERVRAGDGTFEALRPILADGRGPGGDPRRAP